MKKLFTDNKNNPWFWAFVAVAAVLFFAMPLLSRSAGNSGDEDGFQIPQGYNVLNYYKTDHQDTTCMTFENLKYYGCSFDVVTAWFNETFGVDDISRTRHAANAFCGWLAVLFVGLIAYRIGGWRAGVLAMVLMFLSPRFLGHSFNNPKDTPLAAGVVMAVYYIMMFFRQAPKPKWSTMVMLALSIAFAISIRIGGLIILGFFGLWGLLWVIEGKRWKELPKTIGWAALVCVVGFFAGLLLWPYAMQAPLKNSMESYRAMSQFAIAIRQIYNGEMVWSDALPWFYTPKFILTTIPIAVIAGWLLYPFFGAFKKERRVESTMLYFCFLFPVIWIVYTKANVYGGWRHSMFAYPPMVATAALGFNALVERSEKMNGKVWRYAATVLPFVLLIGPAAFCMRNHPYEYVYFNELGGGTKKNFARYELDYYYHSMREATEWVKANADTQGLQPGQKIVVGSWHLPSTKYFLRNDTTVFQPRFVRWYQKGDVDWDYAVFPLTGIDPAYLTNSKVFPPKDMVHAVEVDGVPIAIVLQRHDKSDFMGSQMKKAGQFDEALTWFYKALDYNPYNEAVLLNMAEIFLQTNQPDSALKYCQRFFEFEPNNDNANYFAAYAYLQKGDAGNALAVCDNIKQHNFKYVSAYQLAAQIRMQSGDILGAENELRQAIEAEQIDNNIVQMYVAVKHAQGLDDRMAYTSLYQTIATSLEAHGKKDQAQQYRDALKGM